MIVDQYKLLSSITKPEKPVAATELRREENVFFIGGGLQASETLEALFDSYCQPPAELFHLTFGDIGHFHPGQKK